MTTLLWMFLVNVQFTEPRITGVDGTAQIRFIFSHLRPVLQVFLKSFLITFIPYLYHGFRLMGNYEFVIGCNADVLICFFGFSVMLLFGGRIPMKRWMRLVIFLIIDFVILATIAALYLTFNTVGELNYVQGVQGRYFYGLLPLLPFLMPVKFRLIKKENSEMEEKISLSFMYILLCYYLTCFAVFF